MTPGTFSDGVHDLVLAPDVIAGILDAATRPVWTTRAARRPEITARFAPDQMIGSPVVTVVDDPTVAGAYGGFHFDDAGELATAVPLIDRGKLVGRIARELRPGHAGMLKPMPSHLRFTPGTSESALALKAGFSLEGHRNVLVDPASDRVVIAVQRALEVEHGQRTGRVYADIELVGDLTALLGSITDATKATRVIGLRDERDERDGFRAGARSKHRGCARGGSCARGDPCDRSSLARPCARPRGLADWVADPARSRARDQRRRRAAHRAATRWQLTLHADTPGGPRHRAPRDRCERSRIPTSSSPKPRSSRGCGRRRGHDSTRGTARASSSRIRRSRPATCSRRPRRSRSWCRGDRAP